MPAAPHPDDASEPDPSALDAPIDIVDPDFDEADDALVASVAAFLGYEIGSL